MNTREAATDLPPGETGGDWIHEALALYERPLLFYAARFCHDRERARDVVQETFLRLCRQRREAVEERLREWLFTVCRNCALDVARKEGRVNALTEEQERRRGSEPDSATRDVDVRDSVDHVLERMKALPDNQREALQLKFQHGLSYKEIARVTETSIGTVSWLIHAGLASLRERMVRSGQLGTGREARGLEA
ncbi:MAG: sigma-70 family RNA polymerase sigma factor [Planctomycetes bacterium]|nr:sigma-70 family RNA polymerase sigma factor [Planctomycetota bacterium]